MEIKVCTECGQERGLSEYHIKNGGLRSNCRWCVSKYTKAHYKENKAYYIEKAVFNRKRAQDKLRKFLFSYKRDHPCVDCGESDAIVLEFDHIHGKSDGLASMATRALTLSRLIDEIKKCEVVCANCHRKRTYKRSGWYNKVQPRDAER